MRDERKKGDMQKRRIYVRTCTYNSTHSTNAYYTIITIYFCCRISYVMCVFAPSEFLTCFFCAGRCFLLLHFSCIHICDGNNIEMTTFYIYTFSVVLFSANLFFIHSFAAFRSAVVRVLYALYSVLSPLSMIVVVVGVSPFSLLFLIWCLFVGNAFIFAIGCFYYSWLTHKRAIAHHSVHVCGSNKWREQGQ